MDPEPTEPNNTIPSGSIVWAVTFLLVEFGYIGPADKLFEIVCSYNGNQGEAFRDSLYFATRYRV